MRATPLVAVVWMLAMAAVPATAAEPTPPAPTPPGPAATTIPPTAPIRPKFDRKAYEIPHSRMVLSNGLTVLVHEDHSVPVVAVNLWYHVGSRNEALGKTGFAHLFEHFFFNGSEHYPFGFREAMDDLGANNRNGTTSKDRTNFFEDVPTSALERTLYLEADRMGFLSAQINQAMLERERGVVQNEKRQGENQPYGRVFDRIVQRIYPANHPYSWPGIGSMEDLDAATLQDLQQWYGTYYGPNNCVLSLAGDVTPERALALVKKYFDGIPPGPPLARAENWVPRLNANIREQMQDRVPQARIYRVFHAPAWRDADIAPLQLLASVLSGSRSARLDRRLIYQEKLATDVSATLQTSEIASMLVLTVNVKDGADPLKAEAQLDRVLAEFLQTGPSYAEIERARTRLLAQFSRETESLGGFGGRSTILAESMTFDGRSDGYLNRLERIGTTSAYEVREGARRWLQTPHYTLLITPFPALQPGATQVDRKVVPALGPPPEVAFPKVQHASLPNGLEVILLERHSSPLVNMTLAVDAGYAADSSERAGLASLALELLDDGTSTRDTFRIADELDALGAQIVTGSSLDLSFVRLRALPAKLRPALEIFADVVMRPAFTPDSLDIARRSRLARISQEKAQPVAVAQRVVPQLLFGTGHAYANPLTGSGFESSIKALTRADLVQWHGQWFHPNNTKLIVAGDTTMEVLLPQVDRVFGRWPSGSPPQKQIPTVKNNNTRRVYLIDKPGAPQTVIVAAQLSERGGQDEDLAIDTVMRNFGGMATSRLNRNLRLDKHWSYGTSGVLLDALAQRPLIVSAPVQTDKTREAIVEVLKELKDIAAARLIRGEEFGSIMRTQTLGLPGRFATLASLENAAITQLNYGYPDDYFATYAQRVRELNEQDLATAAAKFIRPDQVTWVIVGDLSVIETGVRALDLGEVMRLDGDGRPLVNAR